MSKEMVGGCCVCSDERGWQENPLVYCDGRDCSVAVHQACYGIVSVPSGPWYCEKCLSQDKPGKVKCELCPMREGAVKHTDNSGWAHVVCALYIPEVRFGNVTTMDPIILAGVPPDRYSRICYICEDKGLSEKKAEGACMQCNKLGCKAAFHVTCAQQEGLLCEESGQMDNIKYCGYCSYHFKKLKKDSTIKMVPPYKPVKNASHTNNASSIINIASSNNNIDNQTANNKRPSNVTSAGGLKTGQHTTSNDLSSSLDREQLAHGTSANRTVGAKVAAPRSSPSSTNQNGGGSLVAAIPPSVPMSKGPAVAKVLTPMENHFHCLNPTPSTSGSHNGPLPSAATDVRRHGPQSADCNPLTGVLSATTTASSRTLTYSSATTSTVSPPTFNTSHQPANNPTAITVSPAATVIPTAVASSSPVPITRLPNVNFNMGVDVMPPPLATTSSGVGRNPAGAPTWSTASGSVNGKSVGAEMSGGVQKIVGDSTTSSTPSVVRVGSAGGRAATPLSSAATSTPAPPATSSSSSLSNVAHKRRVNAADLVNKAGGVSMASSPVAKKRRQQHNASGGGSNVSSAGAGGLIGGGGGSAAVAAAQAKNIANLLTLVSPVVEDTVSSFQREKVQASQQLLLQQQQQQIQHQQQQIHQQQMQQRLAEHQQHQHQHQQQTAAAGQQASTATSTMNVVNGVAAGLGGLLQHQHNQQQAAAFQQHQHNQLTSRQQQQQQQFDALFAAMTPSTGGGAFLPSGDKKMTSLVHQTDDASASAMLRPSLRNLSSDSQGSVFPSSLEQLLERQWEQGSQFLMEQSQHFDVASLLSCLQQLKVENQRLEDHVVNLISRRDHLLAVNARLSLLLPSSSVSSNSSGGNVGVAPPPSSSAHQSPLSPRVGPPPAAVLPPQMSAQSHDFHMSTPSSSAAMVSPPRPPLAAPSSVGGAFNSVVGNPYAAAAALLNVGAGGIKPPVPMTTPLAHKGVLVDGGILTPASSSHLPSTGALPSLTSAAQLAPGGSGGAFAVPQLHAAAQLAEQMVRSHTPLLPPQFALTQDAHHQQMLFQYMQQQAVAYNNALSGLVQQPTTSPHHHPLGMVTQQQQQAAGHPLQTQSSTGVQQGGKN